MSTLLNVRQYIIFEDLGADTLIEISKHSDKLKHSKKFSR